MRGIASPSPEPLDNFSMRGIASPSPEPLDDFGMRGIASPPPEPKSDFAMCQAPSPSLELKRISDFGAREPLFLPDSEDKLEMPAPLLPEPQGFGARVSLSPNHGSPAHSHVVQDVSPLPQAEDFGVLAVPEGGASQIGTHQLTEAEEPCGSSSKAHGEFQITSSYMYLTLDRTAWKWGERAPSPISSSQKGQPSATGEVEHAYESVC